MNTDKSLLPWPWETPEPGIYFNMPFDEYLAIPCLQSSSIKNLLKSPTLFWAKSWMNPLREDFSKDTQAYADGRAYHVRILEGKKRFNELYAPDYEDNPDDTSVIRTSDDLKAALRAANLPVTFKNKAEGAARLLTAKPHARILDNLIEKHRAQFGDDVELLNTETMRYIEFSAKMIECNPHINGYFVGGYPEVTIIYDDERLGLRIKTRVDYLKIMPGCDLKSFANQFDDPLMKAVKKTIDRFLYQIQARLYVHSINEAKQFVKDGRVFGADHVDPEWLKLFSETPCEEFWFCMVQKGIAPVTKGIKMTMRNQAFADNYERYLVPAADIFKDHYAKFGEDFWVDIQPDEYLDNSELWGI